MIKLKIDDINISNLYNCDYLNIKELTIRAPLNINIIFNELYKFSNLEILDLRNNNITEIKGLCKLVKLKVLYLSNNNITEIKGLDKLINLQELYLGWNKIKEIKGIYSLTNLEILFLTMKMIFSDKIFMN